MSLLSSRAQEARDGLLLFARDASRQGVEVPNVVKELLRDLHGQALANDRVSEVGSRQVERETIDDVRAYGAPDEAGRQVGLSGRRVRQLCAAGLVAHRQIGAGRYMVDLDDLQRHLGMGA